MPGLVRPSCATLSEQSETISFRAAVSTFRFYTHSEMSPLETPINKSKIGVSRWPHYKVALTERNGIYLIINIPIEID
jgi:hypothetical protein